MRSCISLILSLFSLPAVAAYYTTTWKYNGGQLPLYEGNNWVNGKSGINWSNVQTYSGFATADRGHDFSDSAALLTGSWGADQDVSASVFIDPGLNLTHFSEVELLLRGTISSGSGGTFRTYEVFFSVDGSEHAWIVRWNGPAGDFTGLADLGSHNLVNGDVVRATIVGQTITAYVNGVSIGTYTDNSASKITSGNPGMGFDSNQSAFDYSKFGYTSFTASDGVTERYVNHAAVSCQLSNVQAALNWCVDSDTNSIPAGNADWSLGSLVMTQTIALVGAGTNSTFITNNVNDWAIQGIWRSGETGIITGITFSGGNQSSAYNCIYLQGANTNHSRVRIYNCKWWNAPGALKLDTVLGCFDHNYVFGNAPGNKVAQIKDSNFDGYGSGNGAWGNATPLLGNEQTFFFEDNTVTSTNTVFVMSMVDAQAGGRYVWRHNIVTNAYIEGHGSEASYERSTHAVELYMNSFYQQGVNQLVTYARGGVWIGWSNKVYDTTAAGCLQLVENRHSDSIFGPFGGSDGRNHWDVNNGGNPFATATTTSATAHGLTVSGATWTPSQWIGYTVRRTSGKTVSSLTCAAGSPPVITVNCTGHGFTNNANVAIFGADQQEYNTVYRITVVNADQFTAQTVGCLPTSPATGTIKACAGNYFALITANTGTTLTFSPSIYDSDTTGIQSLTFAPGGGDDFEINKVDKAMDHVGRTGGSLVDSTATPSFPGAWNNQTASACYQWSNSAGNIAAVWSAANVTIVQNTDYVDNSYPATYASYPYPHYLVGAGGVVEWGATPNLGSFGSIQGKISMQGAINIQ